MLELRLLMSNIIQVTGEKNKYRGKCGDNLNLFKKYLDVLGQTLDCFDLDDDLALSVYFKSSRHLAFITARQKTGLARNETQPPSIAKVSQINTLGAICLFFTMVKQNY